MFKLIASKRYFGKINIFLNTLITVKKYRDVDKILYTVPLFAVWDRRNIYFVTIRVMWLQINTYLDLELSFPELILGWIKRVAKGREGGGGGLPPCPT